MDDLEQALDRLYAAEPAAFVAERDQVVRELRDAGHRDEAAQVKALRKPTLSAWTVNRLARENRREIDLLLDASYRLREAQQGLLAGKGQGFDEARRTQRDALAALRRAASRILDEAGRGGETTLNRAMATLQAAAASEEGRELLARGRLTGDVEATGFELLTPVAGRTPPKRRPKPRAEPKKPSAELRRAQKEAETARRALARAEDRLGKAQAAAAAAREAVKEAESRVRAAERR